MNADVACATRLYPALRLALQDTKRCSVKEPYPVFQHDINCNVIVIETEYHYRLSLRGTRNCIHIFDVDLGSLEMLEYFCQTARTVFDFSGNYIINLGGEKLVHNDATSFSKIRYENPQNPEIMGSIRYAVSSQIYAGFAKRICDLIQTTGRIFQKYGQLFQLHTDLPDPDKQDTCGYEVFSCRPIKPDRQKTTPDSAIYHNGFTI